MNIIMKSCPKLLNITPPLSLSLSKHIHTPQQPIIKPKENENDKLSFSLVFIHNTKPESKTNHIPPLQMVLWPIDML